MRRYSEQERIRREKRAALLAAGVQPYPARAKRDMALADAVASFEQLQGRSIHLAGRLRTIRGHGGSTFATLEDASGIFQIYLRKDKIGEAMYTQWRDAADIGDIIECTGTLFITKKGEKTLEVSSFRFLAKSLTPLPEKWHGLSDIEARYRKRHLDFIANPEVREIFRSRALLLRSIRQYLDARDFLEVETPMLQQIPGGAMARPFVTHHNALDADFYLRIAPELYLKRLITGGFERVYEIGKAFRNEGIDQAHSPEFTILEFYMAYADYNTLMDFTEDFVRTLVKNVTKKEAVSYQGTTIHFKKKFTRASFDDLLQQHAQISLADIRNSKPKDLIKKFQLDIPESSGVGKIADELYKEHVRDSLQQPTFMTDHPVELSPLAKKHDEDPTRVERFQLIVGGMELVNAFSELNDPVDQEERFSSQVEQKKQGDAETHEMDMEYVQALETGMPPTAGFGLGVDRFMMLLADTQNLKDVVLFPTLKPERS